MTAAELAAILVEQKLTVATAESCTGGLVAAELTSIAGSSAFMQGGVVAYSNALKIALLRVEPQLLTDHGAVSREVAAAMAAGVRDVCAADIGMAVTGVAGPDGSEAKPPGLIYLCACRGDDVAEAKLEGDHGRSENRRLAVVAAIELIGRVAKRVRLD